MFLSYIVSFIHSTLSTFGSIYCMYFLCGDQKTFFNDSECREVVRYGHLWLCFFTAGYLFVDGFYLLTRIGIVKPLDRQTLLHHIVAVANYWLAFWQQDFTVTAGAAFIFLEISTIFVCIRFLLTDYGYRGGMLIQNINTMFLVFFFLFGRVLFQLYIVIMYAAPWLWELYMVKEGVPLAYKFLMVEM